VAPTSEPADRPAGSLSPASKLVAGLAIAAGAAVAVGLLAERSALTAPLCFVWPWRDRGFLRSLLHLAPGLLLVAAGVALADRRAASGRIAATLALLAGGSLALQVGAISLEPAGLATVGQRVESSVVTSYFTDALEVEQPARFLAGFDHRKLAFHSGTHPPGPILFYWLFLQFCGEALAPQAGGLAVGVLAALVVPLVALFARRWTGDVETAVFAGALWALLPSIVKFLPEFDQVYPWFTVAAVLAWRAALSPERRARMRTGAAALTGLALALGLFFAWNLLLLGVVLALVAIAAVPGAARPLETVRRTAFAAGVAAASLVAFYFVLHSVTGYRPIASLRHALVWQGYMHLERTCPWSKSVGVGPWDVLLGLGAPVAVLALAGMVAAFHRGSGPRPAAALTRVGTLSLLIVLASGRLPQELARVWIFLFPFLIVPAAGVLSRWTPRWRWSVLAVQALVLVASVDKLTFIGL